MLITSWLQENNSACWDAFLSNNEQMKVNMLVFKSEYNIS